VAYGVICVVSDFMARDIFESLAGLDGASLVEAASRAVVLWPPSSMQDEEHVDRRCR
jgi:hypothetical protein